MYDRPLKWTARLAASAVAVSLMATPVVASAAPSLKSQPKQVPQSQRKAYSAGKKAFDAGDYARAGDEWAAVLSSVTEERKNQGTRMRLVLDTIASYREAYAVDGDIAHLEAAMDSYYGYFKAYKDAYGSPAIPRPVVEARHQLKDELDQAKNDGGGGTAAAAGGSGGSGGSDSGGSDAGGSDASGSTSNNTSSEGDSDSSQPTTHSAEGSSGSTGGSDTGGSSAGTSVAVSTSGASGGDRSGAGTPLIAAGAAAMAVGVGASSLIVVGAIEGQRARTDQKLPGYSDEQRAAIDKRGRQMNALFIAGLVAAPVLVGTGVALVVVGTKKRRAGSRTASVSPMLGGGVAGVTVSGRF